MKANFTNSGWFNGALIGIAFATLPLSLLIYSRTLLNSTSLYSFFLLAFLILTSFPTYIMGTLSQESALIAGLPIFIFWALIGGLIGLHNKNRKIKVVLINILIFVVILFFAASILFYSNSNGSYFNDEEKLLGKCIKTPSGQKTGFYNTENQQIGNCYRFTKDIFDITYCDGELKTTPKTCIFSND